MGNTIVLKGPEANPGTFWALASILHEAGLPAGCLNTLYHRPADASSVTTKLIAHPAVRKINFTGSTIVGRSIASLAGNYLKPCVMELGGKAPSIVLADADLDLAAQQCALGSFLHAGQICMSTERIVVEESVAEAFKQRLTVAIGSLFKTKSQLVSSRSVQRNEKLVADAVGKGARLLYGESTQSSKPTTQMGPVVVEGVHEQMDLYHTESFGPTVSLIVVGDEEDAIRVANDNEYGLSSAVFTKDLAKALRLARRIESGAVHINAMTVHDESALPHGGVKNSGFGRFNGPEGLNEWVKTKVVTWRH
jgi:acyl-CoA reductase-like NAD-dependent aldehyde dehydrogenase